MIFAIQSEGKEFFYIIEYISIYINRIYLYCYCTEKGTNLAACPVSPLVLLLNEFWCRTRQSIFGWLVGHAGIESPHFLERSLEKTESVVRNVLAVIRPPNDVRTLRKHDVANGKEKTITLHIIDFRRGEIREQILNALQLITDIMLNYPLDNPVRRKK